MIKKFKVAIDMDDTLVDTLKYWLAELNRKYGFNVKYEEVKEWDLRKAYPTLTSNEIFSVLFNYDFWSKVSPKKDSIKYVKKLIDDGHEIFICTCSHYRTLTSKFDNCLFKHFPFITSDQIIIMKNKQLLNVDFLIDDALHNLIDAPYKSILIDTPHTSNVNEKELDMNIKRVYSWKEIYDYITEQAND